MKQIIKYWWQQQYIIRDASLAVILGLVIVGATLQCEWNVVWISVITLFILFTTITLFSIWRKKAEYVDMVRNIVTNQKLAEENYRTNVNPAMLVTLKKGDPVIRMVAGTYPQQLTVTDITDTHIICEDHKFNKQTGLEEDEDILWEELVHPSYLYM